jgi:outer membrane receptor protein involved in Fe transport
MSMERTKMFLTRVCMLIAVTLFALEMSAQSIHGNVKDNVGEPAIGATVQVVGQTTGAVTDLDGNFSINAKVGETLRISYVGFDTQEVSAQDGMSVTLKESSSELEEVVVVGYGSLAKKEISSSIVQVDKAQFNQGAVTDPMELVSGKIAGLNVNSTADANPNALSSIQVRGAGSLKAGNGPLIVIDGIAGGDLRNISTQDVESITVLKDAGSAAI